MEDKESCEATVHKQVLAADYYSVICPSISRYYMLEAENIKGHLGLAPVARSNQICKLCCTLWRPAMDGMSVPLPAVKLLRSKNCKPNKRSLTIMWRKGLGAVNPTQAKLLQRKIERAKRQNWLCEVCGDRSSKSYINNMFGSDVSMKYSTLSRNQQPCSVANIKQEHDDTVHHDGTKIRSESYKIGTVSTPSAKPLSSPTSLNSVDHKSKRAAMKKKKREKSNFVENLQKSVTLDSVTVTPVPRSSVLATKSNDTNRNPCTDTKLNAGRKNRKSTKHGILQNLLSKEMIARQKLDDSKSNELQKFMSCVT